MDIRCFSHERSDSSCDALIAEVLGMGKFSLGIHSERSDGDGWMVSSWSVEVVEPCSADDNNSIWISGTEVWPSS